MSYTTILANIKTQLEAVTGIGKVHDYMRFSADLEKHGDRLFKQNNIFHTWFITRDSFRSEAEVYYQVERWHTFSLWGFYQVDDGRSSEKTFQALADTVCNKFDEDSNIVFDANSDQPTPAVLEEFQVAVEFMGVL